MGKFYFLHEFTQLRSLTVVKVHTMYLYIRLHKISFAPLTSLKLYTLLDAYGALT